MDPSFVFEDADDPGERLAPRAPKPAPAWELKDAIASAAAVKHKTKTFTTTDEKIRKVQQGAEEDAEEPPKKDKKKKKKRAADSARDDGGDGGGDEVDKAVEDPHDDFAKHDVVGTFLELNLSRVLCKACSKLGYENPTPIQVSSQPSAQRRAAPRTAAWRHTRVTISYHGFPFLSLLGDHERCSNYPTRAPRARACLLPFPSAAIATPPLALPSHELTLLSPVSSSVGHHSPVSRRARHRGQRNHRQRQDGGVRPPSPGATPPPAQARQGDLRPRPRPHQRARCPGSLHDAKGEHPWPTPTPHSTPADPLSPLSPLSLSVSKLSVFCKDVSLSLVVGGLCMNEQAMSLRNRPEIVIATPNRMIDHLVNTRSVDLDDMSTLVLDEADRLLELGFQEQVKEIISHCPARRQTLLFSATM